MLPPNALAYLKGHPDGVVYVLLAVVSTGTAYAAGPWVGVAGLFVSGLLYHLRCCKSEDHRIALEELKIEQAILKLQAVKGRHRDSLGPVSDVPPTSRAASHRAAKTKSRNAEEEGP